MSDAKNVLGGKLEVCCTSPMTGFYRNGKCDTGTEDRGIHVVCAQVTEEFLSFTKAEKLGCGFASPNIFQDSQGKRFEYTQIKLPRA